MIFRIDDVSVNTDLQRLQQIVQLVNRVLPGERILLVVSPLVHRMPRSLAPLERERAFPRRLSAMSDHRKFFEVGQLGVPVAEVGVVKLASHGLVHVDHRLMGREAQELSIVASCSLVATRTFVPPFNKWNADTESVCREHGIDLVKFEDGWRHVKHNRFDPAHELYYCHTHDVTLEELATWFGVELVKEPPTPPSTPSAGPPPTPAPPAP